MKQKILVIGATGYIGSKLCQTLCEKGYAVYAAALPGDDHSHIKNNIVHYYGVDLTVPSACEELAAIIAREKLYHIVFATGAVNYEQSYETARTANVRPVENFFSIMHLRYCQEVQKIVFIGSIASHGFFPEKPSPSDYLREDVSHYQKGISVYCDVKQEATAVVKKYISTGLKAIIVEPGSLVGKGLGATHTTNDKLVKMIIKGAPVLRGGASYVSLEILAEGIVRALATGQPGETYVLGGTNMSMRDFAVLVRKIARDNVPGWKSPTVPVLSLPKVISSLLARLGIVLNKQQALLGNSYHYIDSSKAEKELGYRHEQSDLVHALEELILSEPE